MKRCYLLAVTGLVLLAVTPAVSPAISPSRGNYVPADPNLKIHPFVENHRYGGTYYRGELAVKTDTGWIVRLHTDPSRRRTIPDDNTFLPSPPRRPGQSVLVKRSPTANRTPRWLITDVNRIGRYGLLFLLSLSACLLVGGRVAARSLVGVFGGLGFLVFYALPAIAAGGSIPLYIGLFYLLSTLLILPASLGFNRNALSAVLAALTAGVLAAGLLYGLAHAMRLTGLRSSSLQVLDYAMRYFPELTRPFSLLNLLLGGMLIGALGVILDVCVDVTSSSAEIARARPDLGLTEHLNRTLTVTSRLIGTMTNTLLLAYIGTDVFLILTVYLLPAPWGVLINKDFVALELLRGFGGALGFLAAAPLSLLFYRLLNTGGPDERPDPPVPGKNP